MLQFATIACYPPLGRSTAIPYGENSVEFTVLIESSTSLPDQPWEAIIWHNGHENREWRELAMHEVTDSIQPFVVNAESRQKVHRKYFSVKLPRPAQVEHPIHFTLKYRTTAASSWRWVNEDLSFRDGEICFQPPSLPKELKDYLKNYSPLLTVKSEKSEASGATLWSITSPLKAADGDNSGWTHISLGKPRDYSKWFSLVRPWTPWLAPSHGEAPFSCGNDSMLLSFKRNDGLSLVLLAVSGLSDVLTVFEDNGKGDVVAKARNEREEEGTLNILAAVAPTFEAANSACIWHAQKLVKGYQTTDKEVQTLSAAAEATVQTQQIFDWRDGLTYCTWNSLGQKLTEDKIYDALDDLKKNKIKVTNLIIDDCWQALDDNDGPSQWDEGWSNFDANPKGFPKGLKHTITKIRDEHPNLKHVAVWHALLGYWNGIDPNGKIAKNYKTKKIPKDGGGEMTVVDIDDQKRMYDDFYQFLLSCSVDAVKTDAQFYLDVMHTALDRRHFMNAVQDVWVTASLRHFGLRAISCMSLFPQNLFHTMLPTDKPRFMVRNSDDFFPEVASSHPWHIFVNAHNALFTSHLNLVPDWDMFQTKNMYSHFHGAARCISGGPVYITDYPGQHDLDLIAQMTAVTSHGQTIALRPDHIGKTTDVYTSYDASRLVRVGTLHGGRHTARLLTFFNVTQQSQSDLVHIHEFPAILYGEEYIIRAHTTGEVSHSTSNNGLGPIVSLNIPVEGYEILTAYPLQSFKLGKSSSSASSTTQVAILGLLGKMSGAAAVTSSNYQLQGTRLKATASLKALGVLGVYVSTAHHLNLADDFLVLLEDAVVPLDTVRLHKKTSVLEVDIERAYKKLGLQPGYANDVNVEILIG